VILRLLPLLWKNVWRNRRRSVLTLLGVGVAVFVIAALEAAVEGMTFPIREVGKQELLTVREAARANVLASRLPAAYEDRVARVPGVRAASGVLSGLAVVGADRVHIFVRGVDPERYRDVQHLVLDPAEWNAFRTDQRTGLVGHRLLKRMGWSVGDEVEVEALRLRVRIVGVIPPQGVDLESHMLVHRSYLQVTRGAENQISYVLVSPAEGPRAADVAAAIDTAMALAPVPTETTSAGAYAQAVIDDFMGFIEYLKVMGAITVVITLLGAANAIAMSVRERTREIGVLKAIGFRPAVVLALVLAESLALSVMGGALGIGGAALAIGNQGARLAGLMLSVPTVLMAAGASLLVGLAGGLLPGLAAANVRTIEALRGIE
jgi:putative ABC transport system permease protein